MSHTPHELAEEFPDKADVISALKAENAHFAKLVEAYHEINKTVHRAESDIEPTDDLNAAHIRKERMTLKDEIWKMICETEQA